MKYNRDMTWTSNADPDNIRKIKFKDLHDKHLANIIRWVRQHLDEQRGYSQEFLDFLNIETDLRGLNDEFLSAAPYAYDPETAYSDEILCNDNKVEMDRTEYINKRIDLAGS